jgi:hypothetical protein
LALVLLLHGIQPQERLRLLTYRRSTHPVLGRNLQETTLPTKSNFGVLVVPVEKDKPLVLLLEVAVVAISR